MKVDIDLETLAIKTLETSKVAIFIVAFNAEKSIQDVIRRIPNWIASRLEEIYLFDDHSNDQTVSIAKEIEWPYCELNIFSTPKYQGYGGNQKLGFKYALDKDYDIVILLHGDGKYAPESLPNILAEYSKGAEVVFGTRFLNRFEPLNSGMPFYKWLGNQLLTSIQNLLLNTKFNEMHCGYRSYSVKALRTIPFLYNSTDFSFDAEIIIQLLSRGYSIKEVQIPTYYGVEIQKANGSFYALQCIERCFRYLFVKYELLYDSRFSSSEVKYSVKKAKTSLHHFVRDLPLAKGSKLIDIGGGEGEAISYPFYAKGLDVTCLDLKSVNADTKIKKYSVNLNLPWQEQFKAEVYDNAIALDILEHLSCPEKTVSEIYNHLNDNACLYASTANVAFFSVRFFLLFGIFNYSNKGILDRTHNRLFTLGSFRQLFEDAEFEVEKIIGFGPPILDLVETDNLIVRAIDSLCYFLARVWPSLFAYQILAICKKKESKEQVLASMLNS